MDYGSTEWKDGLLEVTLAMNTQIHSTIGCAPAELLFRDRSSHIDWLNSQARKDLSIGVEQEDPTMAPIFESSELGLELRAPNLTQSSQLSLQLGALALEPELGIELRNRSSQFEPEFNSEHEIERSSSEPELGIELEPELNSELNSELWRPAPTRAQARVQAQLQAVPSLRIELEHTRLGSQLRARAQLRRRSRARVPAQPRTEQAPIPTPNPIIEKAIAATQRARVSIVRKYTKKHDIQHFDIGAIVSIKVPREDRTSTDNKRLFARILEEPYPHRYQVLTLSGIIKRLIPTKSLGVVEQALWSDIIIPTSTKQVTLGLAAREASTSARVGVSCQCKGQCSTKRCRCYKETKECSVHCHNDEHDCGNLSGLATHTEIALVERPRRKRARADTVGNTT
ncbi:hypothetical protein V493_00729 [Pseudogymnoascus sp. VKM F-4281 (FW-2241)]|nr:hypothetical protein V493_00729 [Pseudogymnoascus sp. VKM F-4281 (FW-2241)]